MCVHVHVHVWAQGLAQSGRSVGTLRVRVTGSCELLIVGPGHVTQSSGRAVCALNHQTIFPEVTLSPLPLFPQAQEVHCGSHCHYWYTPATCWLYTTWLKHEVIYQLLVFYDICDYFVGQSPGRTASVIPDVCKKEKCLISSYLPRWQESKDCPADGQAQQGAPSSCDKLTFSEMGHGKVRLMKIF